jgi:hypothetical protein
MTMTVSLCLPPPRRNIYFKVNKLQHVVACRSGGGGGGVGQEQLTLLMMQHPRQRLVTRELIQTIYLYSHRRVVLWLSVL